MHPLRGGLLLQGLPPFPRSLLHSLTFCRILGNMNYGFLTRKKIFFLSLSLLAGLFACTRISPQATAPSFTPAPVQEAAVPLCLHPQTRPECAIEALNLLANFLFACTHRHALSGTHGFSFPRAYRHPGTHSLFPGADGRYSGTFLFLSGSTGGYRRIYCPKDRIRVHCCRAARRRSGR